MVGKLESNGGTAVSDNREEPRGGGPEDLQPDPLTEKLAPDGAAVLEGILGKGPTDDDWHLFLNRELTRRAEFKASDVLHSEKIRGEDPPFLGTQGTRVYLRRSARVVYTTTGSREVQAEFLRGDIGAGLTLEAGMAVQRGMPIIIQGSGELQDTCGHVESCFMPMCLVECGLRVGRHEQLAARLSIEVALEGPASRANREAYGGGPWA